MVGDAHPTSGELILSFPGSTCQRYSEAPASWEGVPVQVYHIFNKDDYLPIAETFWAAPAGMALPNGYSCDTIGSNAQ